MYQKIKLKLIDKILKLIDISISTKIIPKIQLLNHEIKKYDKSKIEGVFNYGNDVVVDNTSVIIVKKNTSLNLEGKNYIGRFTEIQPDNEISIGYGTSIQDRNIILGDVKIGRFCLTAPNVYISSGNHFYNIQPEDYIKNQDLKALEINDNSLLSMPIIIEDDVWIGINSVIMRGVKLCRGVIVGANTVVTKDVNPYEIVVGNPSRVLKKRLDFKPKKDLFFSNISDLPYFYYGFLIEKNKMEESFLLGGIFATSNFIICIDCVNIKSINIELTNITNCEVELFFKNSSYVLPSNKFTVIDIPIDGTSNFLNFNLKNKSKTYESCLLIRKIVAHEK